MFRATKDIKLPTTITGSLPRPSWYRENLGTRHFLPSIVGRRFREQYEDALTCYLRDQELAGLDILTDGDCRFDDDVGGQSWTAYPPNHMSGLDMAHPLATPAGDRKSTRLNSSHLVISYAVFCLKKKKKTQKIMKKKKKKKTKKKKNNIKTKQ